MHFVFIATLQESDGTQVLSHLCKTHSTIQLTSTYATAIGGPICMTWLPTTLTHAALVN